MDTKIKNPTGYNPKYYNYISTANEQEFFETSAMKNNLSYLIKNNEILIDENVYLIHELNISEEIKIKNKK